MLRGHREEGTPGEMGLEGPLVPGASSACRHRVLPSERGAAGAVSLHAANITS